MAKFKPKTKDKATKETLADVVKEVSTFKDVERQTGASSSGWHHIQTFLRCPMEFKLSQVCGFRVPQLAAPDPLAKGSLFHEGRAWWFTNNFPTGASAWEKLKAHVEYCADMMNPPPRNEALLGSLTILSQYCEHWSLRAKPRVREVEYALGPVGFKPDSPWWHHRTARLDDVSEYPEAMGKLCIGEAKTTSVGADDAENEYTLHGQPMLQWMLWKMAPNGEAKHGPVTHIMLDVVKKGYGKERCTFSRMPVQITEHSLRWYAQSMEHYLNQAARVNVDTPVPRNITACTRLIGRARVACTFRDLCKYGTSAASKYVDKDGASLGSAKYTTLKVKPWD